jgi:cytoskeletal protein CcmA (bactofilin family)
MTKNDKKDSQEKKEVNPFSETVSMIGSSCRIKGNVLSSEDLIVAGQVRGKIEIGENDLTIGETANVKADIQAKNVTIQGQVTGNILATGKVLIEEKAKMTGDITASRISVMDGAKFKGSVRMTQEDAPLL